MKTSKIYKGLMVLCLTLIASLSIMAFSTASAEQAHASCETEQHMYEYSYNSHSGIDLDQFNLVTEKEGTPLPNYHTTSQMNSAIGVSSNCTGNGSFCPGTCNAYQYVGYHYGATTIPYRIEQSAIDEPGLEALIVQATANWNATRIYNSAGQAVQIVNLVRNGTPASGRPVVTVSYGGTHASWAGAHQAGSWGDMFSSTITYYSGGRNIETTQHEFGHVLGLDDLDVNNPTVSDRHRTVLMGYSKTTSAIQYQDIQGAALFNLAHTIHTFTRFDSNNSNREICFYCDGFRTRPSSYSSQALADESTCIHAFQQVIFASDRHWHKCTKCYKVIETPFKVNGLTTTTLEVTGAVGTLSGSVTIPSTIGGQSVTSIGSLAFNGQSEMSQIEIPASVTNLGAYAFNGCIALKTIKIVGYASRPSGWDINWNLGCNADIIWNFDPNSTDLQGLKYNLISGGYEVKRGQATANKIVIPSEFRGLPVIRIASAGFINASNITSIEIPNSIISIGELAFEYCNNISFLTLPSSIMNVEAGAFWGWQLYQTIAFCGNISKSSEWTSLWNTACGANILWDYSPDVPIGFTLGLSYISVSGGYSVSKGVATANEIIIPSIYMGMPVVKIASNGFSSSNITKITIPNSVTTIDYSAFARCANLTSIILPDSITTIGFTAFQYCENLSSIVIPKNIINIESWAFYSSTIKEVYYGGASVLEWNNIIMGNEVGLLDANIFYYSETMNSNGFYWRFVNGIPSSWNYGSETATHTLGLAFNLISGGYEVSKGTAISVDIVIPWIYKGQPVIKIADYGFYMANISKITLPDSILIIGASAFYNCSNLINIILPKNVTIISNNAFQNCTILTYIVIPKSVTSIGLAAINNCALTKVYYGGNDWNSIAIAASNLELINASRCYYSETPIYNGYYWRFVNNIPTIWY